MAKSKTASRKSSKTPAKQKRGAAQRSGGRLEILTSGALADIPWLVHGFSTRTGGFSKCYGGNALNLGVTKEDTHAAVERNRQAFLQELGASDWPLLSMKQVHSDVIHHIVSVGESGVGTGLCPVPGESAMLQTATGRSPVRPQAISTQASPYPSPVLVGDGLISSTPNLLLSVKTADCMPVVIVDPKKRAVGVFHAGWRGTLKRIAEKGVGEMRRWFGSKPADLKAALGPSIRNCCYNVGEEVRDRFRSQFAYADELFREWQTYEDIHLKYPLLFLTMRAPGHSELPYRIFLDVAEANRRQLLDAGLRPGNIEVLQGCTSCDTARFFSHRKEKGNTGRMMTVVGIRAKAEE